MSEVLVILCTFPDSEQARQIGTVLVERQLAACVNLLPAVESIYRWQGKVEKADEVLAIFKTTTAAFPAFEKTLTELHPYQVPEIIAVQPAAVAETYAAWVIGSLA
ncbi:MAG: divalent-cation tolerance protein CutA [Luteolibacter sp.]